MKRNNEWNDDFDVEDLISNLRKNMDDYKNEVLKPNPPFLVGPRVAKILEKAGYNIKLWREYPDESN